MADKNVKDLKKSSTYLEHIPVVGRFFKAARENVEGHGPGTNKMSTPSSELSGGKYQMHWASDATRTGQKKKASDEMRKK